MGDSAQTVNYNATLAKTTISGGKIQLDYNDTLTLSIGTGFPATATMSIDTVLFHNVVTTNGKHAKGTVEKGSWERDISASNPPGVTVSANGSTGVSIKDTDALTVDEDYFYSAVAYDTSTDPSTAYPSDPELVVRRQRSGGSRAEAAGGAGAETDTNA